MKTEKGSKKEEFCMGRGYLVAWLFIVSVLMLLLVIDAKAVELKYSFEYDRSQPRDFVDKPYFYGLVFVFLDRAEESKVSQVKFTLGDMIKTENAVPFDMMGGNDGVANPFDAKTLARNKEHTITAVITLKAGGTQTKKYVFRTPQAYEEADIPVKITWDANEDYPGKPCTDDPDNTCYSPWEQLWFYSRYMDREGYDPKKPFHKLDQKYVSNKSAPVELDTQLPFRKYYKLKRGIIVRSAIKRDNTWHLSEPSIEAFFEVDLKRPEKLPAPKVWFEEAEGGTRLRFSWKFVDDKRVNRWSVQVSDQEATGYKSIKVLSKEGSTIHNVDTPVTTWVAANTVFTAENQTKYFVVVSITKQGNIYSRWSLPTAATYSSTPQEKEVAPVEGLKIQLR